MHLILRSFTVAYLTCFCLGFDLQAQSFLQGYDLFSTKKDAYFTLHTGEELVAVVDDIKRKKGLIEEIKVKTQDGKKRTLQATEVKSMFLSPSGFDKISKVNENLNDIGEWNKDRSVHNPYVKEGYVYFENCTVKLKNGTQTMLMQLVNPGFASKMKVFFDPYAAESAKLEMGGFAVAGGNDKSYYVQKGNETAFRLRSKEYKENFSKLYDLCKELEKEFAEKKNWSYFEKHVYFYDSQCK